MQLYSIFMLALLCFSYTLKAELKDPDTYLPQIDSYLEESFSEFNVPLKYKYSTKDCRLKNGCNHIHFQMQSLSINAGLNRLEMFTEEGQSFGGSNLTEEQWHKQGGNLFRRMLYIQLSRYKEIKIEALNFLVVDRRVNLELKSLRAIEVVLKMKNNKKQEIFKTFTYTNQLPSHGRLLRIIEKHAGAAPKRVVRVNDDFLY